MATQRPNRGSRVATFYPVKSVPPLSSLDSAFQLQEYISLLIRLDVHDVDAIVTLPAKAADEPLQDTSDTDAKDAERKSEPSVDRACWIYEQLRRLAQDLSHPLITSLQQECTRKSCPQMKAGEWLYLCVAHGNDGPLEQCCAIDYILHTLDSATALLNSPRAFPSRISIPPTSYRHFSSLARRLGRIFAHAYFHHREAFQQAEAESSLYARFLRLTKLYDLVPAEFLVIPETAIQPDGASQEGEVEPPRLLAAGIHPEKDIPGDGATAGQPHSTSLIDGRIHNPSHMDGTSSIGTESPRRIGRNRTDTMVFNEAHIVAEELAKGEPSNEVKNGVADALMVQPEQRLWVAQHTELDPGEIDDPHVVEDPVPTVPGSPPVEEVPLISLGEPPSPSDPPATVTSAPLDPALPVPDTKEEDFSATAATVAIATPEEVQEAEFPQTNQENELSTESDPPATPGPEESLQNDEELAASSTQEPQLSSQPVSEPITLEAEEPHSVPTVPDTQEFSLNLNEPSPSEPVPPESDITDEPHDVDDKA